MLKEFIDFVESNLPATSPDSKEKLKEAITQFEKTGECYKFLMLTPLEKLSQGDMISEVPFAYFDEDGGYKIFKSKAIVLSTSCHIDQKDKLVLIPVFPLTDFRGNFDDLKKNVIFDYMYISDPIMSDLFVNFEYMTTYNKKIILTALEKNKVNRICSLNQLGYYLFIIKLTVYLMRKEDSGTLKDRFDDSLSYFKKKI